MWALRSPLSRWEVRERLAALTTGAAAPFGGHVGTWAFRVSVSGAFLGTVRGELAWDETTTTVRLPDATAMIPWAIVEVVIAVLMAVTTGSHPSPPWWAYVSSAFVWGIAAALILRIVRVREVTRGVTAVLGAPYSP
jgi:hypothetical protein